MKFKLITLIAPYLTHYRLRFYRKLETAVQENIVFFFQKKNTDDGRPGIAFWQAEDFQSYSNVSLQVGTIKLSLSLDLLFKIMKQKPNVIILEGASSNLTSWFFILFKNLFRLKVIAWACGWQPDTHHKSVLKLKNILERSFFNHVDWIISYSSTTMSYFSDIGVKTPLTIAYNGIDTEEYIQRKENVIESAAALRQGVSGITFLYVGGLLKDKKVDFLIESFIEFQTEASDSRLWVIGNGPLKGTLESMTENKNIRFFGRIEEGVDPFFAAADFFILPGVGGLALNQAMLWGTPCIVSEADGTENDLVTDSITGFRFQKDNKGSLITAMRRAMMQTREERDEMSQRAQKLILERSNTDEMVNTFVKVLANFC